MVSRTFAVTVISVFVALVTIQQVVGSKNVQQNNIFSEYTRDLVLGERINGDELLTTQTIKNARRPYLWTSDEFKYPTGNENNMHTFITNVVVSDNTDSGDGAYAILKEGGPGSSKVVIRLASSWNKGFDSTIEVYGFPAQKN